MDSIFSSLIIPAQTKLLVGGGVSRNHPVHPSVQISYKSNFSLMNEPVLMKFYTVATRGFAWRRIISTKKISRKIIERV